MASRRWILLSNIRHSKLARMSLWSVRLAQRFIKIYAVLMLLYSFQFGFPVHDNVNNPQMLSDPRSSAAQTTFVVSADGQ